MIIVFKSRTQLSLKQSNQWLKQIRNFSDETTISSFISSQKDEAPQRVAKRPVNYIPDHLGQTRKWQKQKPWWKFRYFINLNHLEDQRPEWTETPQYPPLTDHTTDGMKKEIRKEWYEAIKRLPTAQQKEYEICKHYSHLSYILEPIQNQYNALPFQQFVTRTHLISGHMPHSYEQMNVDSLLDTDLKQQILESVGLHLFGTKQRRPLTEFRTSALSQLGSPDSTTRTNIAKQEDLIEDVITIVRRALNSKYQHLSRLQMDVNPYVCSSWWKSEFPIPFTKKNWFPNDFYDQQFTYKATHCLHLRSEKPLSPAISLSDDICLSSQIPEYKYRLIKLGYPLKRNSFTTLPGFWSDKSCGFDFPNLLCHTREGLELRRLKNETLGKSLDDTQQALDGMAILSSFSWLHSLASNLGFTVYHELTYPLVTHAIITDGQFWSFYVYQLNSHSFHSDVDTNSLRNVCWSSGDLKLFDDYQNGNFIGVNDEVFKLLFKFMTRTPEVAVDINLRPYLRIGQLRSF